MLRRLQHRVLSHAYQLSKAKSRVGLYKILATSVAEFNLEAPAITLNVGAGGEVAGVISSAGAAPNSVDIDPDRDPDIVASVEDLHMIEDESLDGVFCMEVLEHVRDPFSGARELSRILKPGGVLIGSTPFLLGIHDAPNDYFRFTKYGIGLLFPDLECVRIQPRNSAFEASEVIVLRLFAVGTEQEKVSLCWRLPFIRVAFYMLWLCGLGTQNTDATTGYFFVFRKKLDGECRNSAK
jgi:SAM-dependent methyltransferase